MYGKSLMGALAAAAAVFGAAAVSFARDDGFAFPANDPNYPVPTIEIGTDFLFEAEQGLRVFGEDVQFAPEDVYLVDEWDGFSGGKIVQFILNDPGGRFADWSLTFPFILPEEAEVRILYNVSFFYDPAGGEGKAFVKMDDNQYDVWPEDFVGHDPLGFGGIEYPPDDGGGWIQINNWSNQQRKDYPDLWGENADFRTIWAEGNWWQQQPEVEILAWQLPAGEHVFKMTPRSGGNFAIDYLAVVTSDFERLQFDFDPAAAQKLEIPSMVGEYMIY